MNKKSNKDKDRSLDPRSVGGPLSLREAMNRLFDESIWDPFDQLGGFWPATREAVGFPRVNLSENEKNVTVTADVPGMDPDNIDIEIEEDALIISGEAESEEKEEQKDFYRLEREYGQFRRIIPLPARVDPNKAEAQVDKGVLRIVLPKTGQERRKKVKIKK